MLFLIFVGILGALIGSFANVVIYRLPKGESIVFPGSHCPNCQHHLGVLELAPIASWVALRGRCRHCRAPISARYPLIEALTALGFVLLALRWPPEAYGLTVLPLLALFAMLVMLALIDVDHYMLPDSLTLPAILVGLFGTLLYDPASGLPAVRSAIIGGAVGAGILVFINRLGSLLLRRLADTKERLWPLGMDQVNVAAVGGALGGWAWGLGLAGASFLANLLSRRTLRLPEPLLYLLWVLALVGSSLRLWIAPQSALAGTLIAAVAAAVLGATFWWVSDLGTQDKQEREESGEALGGEDEPVAMGFGDVKLAAVLGVMLGWQSLLVALLASFIFGAVGGVIGRAFGGERQVPFGPYLALGGMVALFYGPALVGWYAGLLGVG